MTASLTIIFSTVSNLFTLSLPIDFPDISGFWTN